MRILRFATGISLFIVAVCFMGGCVNPGGQFVKDRGVYTTLAITNDSLTMPGSSYTQFKSFSPGQSPAAVVLGYGFVEGDRDRPQEFNLQLIESGNGAVILDRRGSVYPGKASYVNLPVRKSGGYQLKLLDGSTVYDTWDFTVDRGAGAESISPNGSVPVYAKTVGAAMEENEDARFANYDAYFLSAVNRALEKASNKADEAIFAQVPPGKVVVSLQLDDSGKVTSSRIVENTLSNDMGEFFVQALQKAAPYKPWTADVHSREIKLTFYYQ